VIDISRRKTEGSAAATVPYIAALLRTCIRPSGHPASWHVRLRIPMSEGMGVATDHAAGFWGFYITNFVSGLESVTRDADLGDSSPVKPRGVAGDTMRQSDYGFRSSIGAQYPIIHLVARGCFSG